MGADTDTGEDVYQRSGGSTALVSTGPSGNGTQRAIFDGSSTDGTRVFFQTRSSLVATDSDGSIDLYERAGGVTTLVSTSSSAGNGEFDVHFAGASDDGTRVFFTTKESLAAVDTDSRLDIYERFGGATTLISTGLSGGNGGFDAFFDESSRDGTRVFFTTGESLVSGDTDTVQDVYERQGNATTLISTGPAGGNGAHGAFFADVSDDGTRVFFLTGERLAGERHRQPPGHLCNESPRWIRPSQRSPPGRNPLGACLQAVQLRERHPRATAGRHLLHSSHAGV